MNSYNVTDSGMTKEFGINKDRHCTDAFCFLVFMAFLGSLLGCMIYSMAEGDVSKMLAPYDGLGNFCGIGDFAEYPDLFLSDMSIAGSSNIAKSMFAKAVCVKSCPQSKTAKIECPSTYDPSWVNCATVSTVNTANLLGYCIP